MDNLKDLGKINTDMEGECVKFLNQRLADSAVNLSNIKNKCDQLEKENTFLEETLNAKMIRNTELTNRLKESQKPNVIFKWVVYSFFAISSVVAFFIGFNG